MDPHIFVIFGASGDLAERKLVPALFSLFSRGFLPDNFALLGVSRSSFTDEAFRDKVLFASDFLELDAKSKKKAEAFAKKVFYQAIDTGDEKAYAKVKKRLKKLDDEFKTDNNFIFYLSVPPKLYQIIPEYLNKQGLNNRSNGWSRLIIEKPFGYDSDSAQELNEYLLQHFDEDQIYRIDHYLGKETVQNMLVTRFANNIFEPLWNRNHIHNIQITAAESIGVEGRGGYYDDSGALRDMVQNHLMQILAHIAMEAPISADARAIRNEKVKLFQSLRPIPKDEVSKYVVRGQYTDSKKGQAYRKEEGVPDDSRTETFVAMKFFIDNWRWAGVPFYLRTGKGLPTKVTEVVVTFQGTPHRIFQEADEVNCNNQLTIRIQPEEGLSLQFGMKIPGEGFRVKDVEMDFQYSELTEEYLPGAYERLIMDCIKGDATLYARGDSVESAWAFIDPILQEWEDNPKTDLHGYPVGTWGPDAANKLFQPEGGSWNNPTEAQVQKRGRKLTEK